MSIKRWPKIGDEIILAESYGRIFAIQKFRDPVKNTVEDYALYHNDYRKIPVVVFPLVNSQTIIAIQQFRHGANDVLYELPGGNLDFDNETPAEIAARELKEETGYEPKKVVPLQPQGHSGYWFEPSTIPTAYIPFLATDCLKISEQKLDHGEYIKLMELPIAEWLALIATGMVTDSKSIVTTFLSLLYLGIDFKQTPK